MLVIDQKPGLGVDLLKEGGQQFVVDFEIGLTGAAGQVVVGVPGDLIGQLAAALVGDRGQAILNQEI